MRTPSPLPPPLPPFLLLLLLPPAACGPVPALPAGPAEAVRPGDLVFTEILADPVGEDAGAEWVELANVSGLPLDLGGLTLTSGARGDGPTRAVVLPPLAVPAEARIVLAAAPGPGIDLVWDPALGALRNEDGRLALEASGLLIDAVTWTRAPPGRPLVFDGARAPDAVLNDTAALWCTPDGAGTPGQPNGPCPPDPDDARCFDGGLLRSVRAPTPGDLVLTEVMADPSAVEDADGEWFEVLALADVDLNGLVLGPDADTPVDELAREDCVVLPAGAYAVFARQLDPARNGGLPRAELRFGFSLTNREGGLALSHGGRTLDTVTWEAASAGVAHSRTPPAPVASEEEANPDVAPDRWCPATGPMANGDLGTPGAPNPACPIPVPPGHCLEDGTVRQVRPPAWGEVRINEVLADPQAVPDADGEWLELLVLAPVDLNGLAVGAPDDPAPARLEADDCLAAAPGDRLLLARDGDGEANGGLPPVDGILQGALVNAAGSLALSRSGGLVDWVELARPVAGTAASRDEATGRWCAAVAPFGAGDLGTPGAENPPCP